LGKKNPQTIRNLLFTAAKKIEKNIISPNFNPNNLEELYMRVGIHLAHNNFEGQFS
jgi:hypothetical protein